MLRRSLIVVFTIMLISCGNDKSEIEENNQVLTLYTHRHYDTDKEIFKAFFDLALFGSLSGISSVWS